MDQSTLDTDGPRLDAARLSAAELRRVLTELAASAPHSSDVATRSMHIDGVAGRDHLLMALDAALHLIVEGPLGDYACALNRQAQITVSGSVGDGAAEGMASGIVRIQGTAGAGAGATCRGGTMAIYGDAASGCGAAMQGGEIFVKGSVGPGAAAGALGGTLVIAGDAAPGLGDSMRSATIFIRGKTSGLGRGVREAPLRERERVRLGLLLINAGMRGEAKEFRRIVSEVTLQEEARRTRGEVDPSWR